MNYLEQIQGFWRSHEEHSFNTTEIALYFHLLKVCNTCHWKNPFKRNNAKITADLSISFNTLKNARNRLQQCKLITFKTTNGSPNVTYTLSNFDKVIAGVIAEVSSKVADEVSSGVGAEVLPTKGKLSKTKRTTPSPPSQGGVESLEVDNLNQKARGVFEAHFLRTYSEPYYWAAKDAGSMTGLLGKLRYRQQQKRMPDESDEGLLLALKTFLESIKTGWVFENFSVPNINSKFNEIITQIKNDSEKKQPTAPAKYVHN